jgi:hypothetical protein
MELRWIVNVRDWRPTEAQWRCALEAIRPAEDRVRIQRFHKGRPSAVGYPHFASEDALCLTLGRLALQRAFAIHEALWASRAPSAEVKPEPLCHHPFPVPSISSLTEGEDGTGIGEVPPLSRTAEGRPCLAKECGPRPYNINISHAGCLVCLASHPSLLVGTDIMPVELVPSEPSYNEAALIEFFGYFTDNFTAAEWAWIRNPPTPGGIQPPAHSFGAVTPPLALKRFYVLWTLKEAFIKAIGMGLNFPLQSAEFSFLDSLTGKPTTVDVDDPRFFNLAVDTGTECSPPAPAAGNEAAVVVPTLQLSGKPAPKWQFYTFQTVAYGSPVEGPGNTTAKDAPCVGALAVGPQEDAATPSYRETIAPTPTLPTTPGNITGQRNSSSLRILPKI